MSCFDPQFSSRPGFARMYRPGALTLGLLFPLESYDGPVPRMDIAEQTDRARAAERAGFAALWARDIPLLDPSFGDAGQMFDPWVWLTHIAAVTSDIAVATGSTVLPLRNPIDTAKAAASLDLLSGQRLVLGAAAGDRGAEFPAYGLDREDSGALFRTAVTTLRRLWSEDFPAVDSSYGSFSNAGVLPKPSGGRIPVLVTGNSRQSVEWIAEHGDGWLMYPKPLIQQRRTTALWRDAVRGTGARLKPFSQSLYVDLVERPDARPSLIHLGYRTGRRYLTNHLSGLRDAGVNHVVLNLKYGRRPVGEVLQELAEHVVPQFPAHAPAPALAAV
ncbi:LLM class oxidoreductase [Streptomyces sp. NPDC051956]|uniref:LLM class oxidoreductase n=1 Tax=Streptomyces sp. NPDC051956 TaxID=3365677 RepID=UPI0037CD5683